MQKFMLTYKPVSDQPPASLLFCLRHELVIIAAVSYYLRAKAVIPFATEIEMEIKVVTLQDMTSY